jgi:excisionase family DNA binding protein
MNAMADPLANPASGHPGEVKSARISIPEIARRLDIGRQAVYALLERGVLPGIRLGRRWIITRHAYEAWERTCGTQDRAGLVGSPEVKVLN